MIPWILNYLTLMGLLPDGWGVRRLFQIGSRGVWALVVREPGRLPRGGLVSP